MFPSGGSGGFGAFGQQNQGSGTPSSVFGGGGGFGATPSAGELVSFVLLSLLVISIALMWPCLMESFDIVLQLQFSRF